MRVLVTGGRFFNLPDVVHEILYPIHSRIGIKELGEGGATGADELSKLWALSFGIPVASYEANWKTYGNRAGRMRNCRMRREFNPDMGVAFPGNDGTQHMIGELLGAKIPTLVGRFTDSTETKVNWERR